MIENKCVTGGYCTIELSVLNSNTLYSDSRMKIVLPAQLEISSGMCSATDIDDYKRRTHSC